MGFLQAKDTISGQEGKAFVTINGVTEEMFYVKKLEAKMEKEKSEIKTLGRRGTQHKAKGWKGSGSMTIYYVTTKFRQMMYDYMSTGKDTYFDIQIKNEDPTSAAGTQTIAIKNVNINSLILAKLDTESDALDEELDFTFENVEIMSSFTKSLPLG